MTRLSDVRELPAVLGTPLSDEQLHAATAPLEPQLVVAGAGTGKTTVMAARVVWLVGTGQVQPHEVLGLTFTNQATAELRHRIRAAIARLALGDAGDGGDPTVSTYHAFAGQLVAEHGLLLGIESDSRLLADGQRSRLAYSVACDPLDATELSGTPETVAARLRGMDDALADQDVSCAELAAYDTAMLAHLTNATGPAAQLDAMVRAARQRLAITRLVGQFRDAKADGEWLDFADQVRLGSQLAREVPAVGEQLRRSFRVVLLDEYQDTSRAQRRMLQALFGHGHPVTAVGDPCQAIYGWRGASVTNIDQFPRHFPAPAGHDAAVHELTVNRRSRPAVLTAANRVATGLRAFHEHVRPLRPPAEAGGGRLTCALVATWDDELQWLGSQLAELGAGRPWHDMAVLCRTNDQVADVVGHLRERGIPAHVSSRRDLLALPEVVAVVTLLRVLVDPLANPALLHHLVGPRWRIGPRDLALLGRRAKDLAIAEAGLAPADPAAADLPASLLDAVGAPGPATQYPYSPEARARFGELMAEIDGLARLRDRGAADVVAAAVDLLSPALVDVDADALPPSLHALVSLAQGFRSLDGRRELGAFVAFLDDCDRFDASPRDEEWAGAGVSVMTAHAAKGLEFPVVALPFLSKGAFPAATGAPRWVTSPLALPPVAADEPDPAITLGFPGDRFTTKDHRAYVAACAFDDRLDEDRLAYVAVTRAKDVLLASGHWWGPSQTRPRGPSDYLLAVRDAGADVPQWVAEPGERPDDPARTLGTAAWPPPVTDARTVDLADAVTAPPGSQPSDAPAGPWLPLVADLLTEPDPARPADPVVPGVVSASALTTWLRQPDRHQADARRPMPRRPTAAAAAGTAFHSWIEHRGGQQVLFDLPGNGSGDTEAYERLLARTRFAERTPFAVEVPFVLAVRPDLAVTGRIDAVFAVTDDPAVDWEVVDWKTGDPDRADPSQLVVYRSAWAHLQQVPESRVRATFVFLADGTDRSFDDLVPVEEVAAALGPAASGAP